MTTPQVRLAELVVLLSLVSDLGMGQPMEHALRQYVVARRLGERIGLDPAEQEALYYAGLLAWVGCHVDAYEQAKWFGDDLAVKYEYRSVDAATALDDVLFLGRRLGGRRPLPARVPAAVRFVVGGGLADLDVMLDNHCVAAARLAADLGLDPAVQHAIEQTFERWDGRGQPRGARGSEVLLVSRLVNLADVVEVFHRVGGVAAAVAVARRRRGTQFDPDLVDAFGAEAAEILADLDAEARPEAVLSAHPGLARPLAEPALDAALDAIADFVDLKSPYTIGHSRGVALLAGRAAASLRLPAADVTLVGRAGLLHDLGRMGVPNSVWDQRRALGLTERERVRLHPYLTERTLAWSPGLAPSGAAAVQHHERLDGSGYPRGLRRDAIGPVGRLLAAADVYQALTQPRPHREAATPPTAAEVVRAEVRAGRLDGDVAEAVLEAAGHRRRRGRIAGGLTPREVQVLRLLALGLPTKQIASRLGVSRKTAANHVEHIYAKLGVTNRALASLAAVRLGLLPDAEPDPATPGQRAGGMA